MRVEFLPAAQSERVDAAEFLERRRSGFGLRFSKEVQAAVERICRNAASFPADPDSLPGDELRYVRTKSFPYRLVFVIIEADLSLIVAVVHDSQRPGDWRRRN